MSAIEQGYQQQEIHTTAYRYFNEIENNTRKIVGVNHGLLEEDIKVQPMKLNPKVTEEQHKRLKDTRIGRDAEGVAHILSKISDACSTDENVFPLVIEAVKLNATLGEIMKAMKDVFGTYMAPSGF
jgi:methylmalonyl-CoA mutase N-terminal domain/subunit